MPAASQPVSVSDNSDNAQHNPDNFYMIETEQPVTESNLVINVHDHATSKATPATVQLPNTPTCIQQGSFSRLLSPS